MIVGPNSSNPYALQPAASPARERTDVARNPAARPELAPAGSAPGREVARPANAGDLGGETSGENLQRRVQARQAAEDVRIERFRADEISYGNARALAVFAGVAGQREGQDTELSGIDIRV